MKKVKKRVKQEAKQARGKGFERPKLISATTRAIISKPKKKLKKDLKAPDYSKIKK